MQRTLFCPLGMTNSSYLWQEKFEALAVAGHTHHRSMDLAVLSSHPLYSPLPGLWEIRDRGNERNRSEDGDSTASARRTKPSGRSYWHWGDNGDCKALVTGSEVARRAVVIFTNNAGGMMIIADMVREVMGETPAAFATTVSTRR